MFWRDMPVIRMEAKLLSWAAQAKFIKQYLCKSVWASFSANRFGFIVRVLGTKPRALLKLGSFVSELHHQPINKFWFILGS